MKNKINFNILFAIFLLVIGLALSIIIYPDAYVRIWISIKYLFSSFQVFFTKGDPGSIHTINPPGSFITSDLNVPADVKEAFYLFKTWSIALFNRDILLFGLLSFLSLLNSILKFIVWVPYLLIIIKLISSIILSEKEENIEGDSKALIKFKKIENKFIRPLKSKIISFREDWQSYPIFNTSLILLILLTYRGLAILIDTFGWYLQFTRTFNLNSLFNLISSISLDIFYLFYRYDHIIPFIIFALIILKLRKNSARKFLSRMQYYNEDIAENLSIITLITGHIGAGKTMMATSLALDIEMQFREKALGILKKYTGMFPNFPWDNLERFIVNRINLENDRRLSNRAQISSEIHNIYSGFIKNINNGKSAYLFGYDFLTYGLDYFNGIQRITLLEAMDAYGQAFFLYFANKPLAFSNYSTRFDFLRYGYFPLYDYDYINRDKNVAAAMWNDYYSSIINMDSHRITNHVGSNPDEYYLFDGGVETITEIDKERGNRFDQQGKEKTSDEANQLNDGWNKHFKIIRHEHTIDNETFVKTIMDTQRTNSVNLDLVETAEDRIHIKERSDLKMTLPFFEIDYLLCSPLISKYEAYYYQFRNIRKDKTLYNYLLGKVVKLAYDHFNRTLNEFSYREITFKKEIGKTTDNYGRLINQKYYLITQKIFADKYRTDCYSDFFKNQRMGVKKGFLDAEMYNRSLATKEELEKQKSYWIEDLTINTNYSGQPKDKKNTGRPGETIYK